MLLHAETYAPHSSYPMRAWMFSQGTQRGKNTAPTRTVTQVKF